MRGVQWAGELAGQMVGLKVVPRADLRAAQRVVKWAVK